MPRKGIFALVLFFLLKQTCSFPSREDFMNNWCGDENCYDLLEVKNSADKEDIVKKYKQLAIKYHPDKNRDRVKEVESRFKQITHAYTILSDHSMRERYDEVVRIKARMFVPKENPIFVAFLILLVLIGFRYYYEGYQHRNKRRRLLENEAVRRRIKKKMLSEGKKLRIRNNTLDDDISDLMLIEAVKELNIKVPGGFKGRPSIYEVVVSVPSIPGSWAHRVYYGIRWMVKYELLHQQFDDSDKEYLTFKALGLTEKDWKQLSEEEKNRYLQRDLWKRKNIAKKD